jgi:hypothetical protein
MKKVLIPYFVDTIPNISVYIQEMEHFPWLRWRIDNIFRRYCTVYIRCHPGNGEFSSAGAGSLVPGTIVDTVPNISTDIEEKVHFSCPEPKY